MQNLRPFMASWLGRSGLPLCAHLVIFYFVLCTFFPIAVYILGVICSKWNFDMKINIYFSTSPRPNIFVPSRVNSFMQIWCLNPIPYFIPPDGYMLICFPGCALCPRGGSWLGGGRHSTLPGEAFSIYLSRNNVLKWCGHRYVPGFILPRVYRFIDSLSSRWTQKEVGP